MKRITVVFICLLLAISALAQEKREFAINGKFPTSYYDGLTVYLNTIDYKDTNNVVKKDSVLVVGDKFTLKGVVEKPISLGYVTLAENEEVTAVVVLETGTINLEMNDVPQMDGTVKNEALKEFTNGQLKNKADLEAILEKAQSLHRAGSLDEATANKMEQEFNDQRKLMQSEVYDFVSSNILNEVGEFFFTIYASNFGVKNLEKLYAASTEEFQQSFQVKSLMNQYVWSLGNLREGKEFKGIEMKTPEGEVENISKHFGKGKVVLVDFWASWCAPCLKTMPILVKLYDRYQDSGFEIVGISLDQDESPWKTAIKRLNMAWSQYIDDGGGWKGGAAKEYNITRIPQTYLLDREGKIAGHDLAGTALIEKIEELLTEKEGK